MEFFLLLEIGYTCQDVSMTSAIASRPPSRSILRQSQNQNQRRGNQNQHSSRVVKERKAITINNVQLQYSMFGLCPDRLLQSFFVCDLHTDTDGPFSTTWWSRGGGWLELNLFEQQPYPQVVEPKLTFHEQLVLPRDDGISYL